MDIMARLNFLEKVSQAMIACHFADVVELTFDGGRQVAKDAAVQQAIVEDERRRVTTERIACASRDEALALIEAIGGQQA